MNYEIDTQSLSRVDALRIINEDSKNLKEVKIATIVDTIRRCKISNRQRLLE